jgi:hypothetical protein
MTYTGSTLRLFFTSGSGSFKLEVTSERRSTKHIFEGSVTELQGVRKDLSTTLDTVKEAVMRRADEGRVEFGENLDQALSDLLEVSVDLRSRLAGGDPQKALELLRLLKHALALQPAGSRPALVEVKAPRDLWVPIELLALEHPPRLRVRDEGALSRVCRQFVGFSAIIRRTLDDQAARRGGLSQNRVLLATPSLPMTVFHDASLQAAQLEGKLLAELRPRIDIEGPWPQHDLEEDELKDTLLRHLFDPTTAVRGGRRRVPDQIQHFACHCDTTPDDADQYSIHLGAAEADGAYVSLKDIRNGLALVAEQTGGDQPPLPLVFLNACGSAAIDYRATPSFPARFLAAGNRGFIGTETNIPDIFAARFAERFYRRLLDGESAGEALNAAKWDMVKTLRNPLGILYTMYADPDLRIGSNAKEALGWRRLLKPFRRRSGSLA